MCPGKSVLLVLGLVAGGSALAAEEIPAGGAVTLRETQTKDSSGWAVAGSVLIFRGAGREGEWSCVITKVDLGTSRAHASCRSGDAPRVSPCALHAPDDQEGLEGVTRTSETGRGGLRGLWRGLSGMPAEIHCRGGGGAE